MREERRGVEEIGENEEEMKEREEEGEGGGKEKRRPGTGDYEKLSQKRIWYWRWPNEKGRE